MSNPQPAYTFLPWVRQGAAAAIANTAATHQSDRVAVTVKLQINGKPDLLEVPIQLYGPGDVTGIDPRQVIRTEPPHLTMDFEPNYFPAIEFDRPDFPWLFTPLGVDAQGHLLPWLSLVVVRKQDGVTLTAEPGRPLPVLAIAAPANPAQELPNLTEAWAWAHAQVCWVTDLDQSEANEALTQELHQNTLRSLSRLLCPRQLEPNLQYYACLVPTFAAGRQAGLGEPVTASVSDLAWDLAALDGSAIELPVYYHWEFSTGATGDFEFFLRRLQVRDLPQSVGHLTLEVPGLAPDAPGARIALEGALRPLKRSPAASTVPSAYQQKLRALLNAPENPVTNPQAEPMVAPPIYGSLQAAQVTVHDSNQASHWLRQLNLDPRYRVAAGLGAQVIRNQQEQLMTAAWEQVGQVQQTNRLLQQAQLAREASSVIYEKHLKPLGAEAFLQVTSPVHHQIKVGGKTIEQGQAKAQAQTQVQSPTTLTTPATLRRLVRSQGAIARQFSLDNAQAQRSLFQKLATDTPATPLSPQPSGIGAIDSRISAALANLSKPLTSSIAKPSSDRLAKPSNQPLTQLLQPSAKTTSATKAATAAPLQLPALKQRILEQINPQTTILNRVRQQIATPQKTLPQTPDPLAPVMAAPSFPQPMYESLRDLFQEMLLPGLDQIPPNTIALLETNPQFIEAFMVGLNHEMSRELLWREYPTDQRGTYFQNFWDRRSQVGGTPTPDIAPIHQWSKERPLGSHLLGHSTAGQLLLLIRGDFLRRYPTATIYAVKAAWKQIGSDRRLTLGTEETFPLFQGRWQPDVTFLGFPLTAAAARGGGDDPGYFFVIQEQPTAPRFGLDARDRQPLGGLPRNWWELSWSHLVRAEDGLEALKQLTHVSLQPSNRQLAQLQHNQVAWGRDAAHMASITLQKPVRIAIHASTWILA